MSGFSIGIVAADRTRELRRCVLRPWATPGDALPGDGLPGAVFLGATDDTDGTLLGTCFVYPEPCPWRAEEPSPWRLRSMATHPAHRSAGIGAAVLLAALELAAGRGATYLWLNARENAIGFYARYGFVPHGALFLGDGEIPHRAMGREPSARPTSSSR